METLEFLVEAGNAGQRLDRFLAERELGLTRNALQQLIEEGYAPVQWPARREKPQTEGKGPPAFDRAGCKAGHGRCPGYSAGCGV